MKRLVERTEFGLGNEEDGGNIRKQPKQKHWTMKIVLGRQKHEILDGDLWEMRLVNEFQATKKEMKYFATS